MPYAGADSSKDSNLPLLDRDTVGKILDKVRLHTRYNAVILKADGQPLTRFQSNSRYERREILSGEQIVSPGRWLVYLLAEEVKMHHPEKIASLTLSQKAIFDAFSDKIQGHRVLEPITIGSKKISRFFAEYEGYALRVQRTLELMPEEPVRRMRRKPESLSGRIPPRAAQAEMVKEIMDELLRTMPYLKENNYAALVAQFKDNRFIMCRSQSFYRFIEKGILPSTPGALQGFAAWLESVREGFDLVRDYVIPPSKLDLQAAINELQGLQQAQTRAAR